MTGMIEIVKFWVFHNIFEKIFVIQVIASLYKTVCIVM